MFQEVMVRLDLSLIHIWQVFFRAKLQLVADSLPLFAFFPHDLRVKIPFHRKMCIRDRTYKVPYETHPADRLRQCVFGGSSNTLDLSLIHI